MDTAIVGVLCSAGTLIIRTLIDLCVKRYERAQEIKEAREDLEADLRRQIYLWSEHAYAVRAKALKAGVGIDELPPLPKEG